MDQQTLMILGVVAVLVLLAIAGGIRRWTRQRANAYGARASAARAQERRDAWTKGSTRWTDSVVLGTDASTATSIVETALERVKGVQRTDHDEWSVKVISDDDHRVGLHGVEGGVEFAVRYYPSVDEAASESTMTLSDWQRIVQRVRDAAAEAGVAVHRGSMRRGRVEQLDRASYRHHLTSG